MCYLRILKSNPMLNMNTKGVTCGVGSTHTTEIPEFTLGFKLFCFPVCFTLNVPDEGCISNVSSALYKHHFRLKNVL